jgi:hypothetical protein
MMNKISRFDFSGALLIGAAIATGNPAFADFGLASIVLPVLVAVVFAATARSDPARSLTRGLAWIGALYCAFIFLWYEQYKLLGAQGSIDLFTTITDWLGAHGHEKLMRIGVGCCEITASIFLLIPRVQGLGGIGAIMLMTGALFFHLVTPLGVDPYGDGGILFKEACSVWISGWLVVWWRRDQLVALADRFGLPVPSMLRHIAA